MVQLERSGVLQIARYQDRYEESDKFNLAGQINLLYGMYEDANLEMDSASILGQNCILSYAQSSFWLMIPV